MFDILIYLLENYVNAELDIVPEPDRDSLKTELVMAGFADRDIDHALLWLESLATLPAVAHSETRALRVFDPLECSRLDVACRGYIQHLENLGILSAQQREWIIDRLMALSSEALANEELDIDQIKWVVLMVLFSQPEEAKAYMRMEDLMFAEQAEYVVH